MRDEVLGEVAHEGDEFVDAGVSLGVLLHYK